MAQDQRMGGWELFAGVLMLLTGAWGVIEGLIAILDPEGAAQFVGTGYQMGQSGWGAAHLILGALVAIVGLGVLNVQSWARIVGIFVVSINLFSHMFTAGGTGWWSLIIIGLDVVIIYALCVYPEPDVS